MTVEHNRLDTLEQAGLIRGQAAEILVRHPGEERPQPAGISGYVEAPADRFISAAASSS